MTSQNNPLKSVLTIITLAVLSGIAASALIANIVVEDWRVNVRNFDITVLNEATGLTPDCYMNVTGTELVNGTYPPTEWSGPNNQNGHLRGWLRPGKYGAAISCTDDFGNQTVIPSSISVSFWGYAEISISGAQGDARSAIIDVSGFTNQGISESPCDCTKPSLSNGPVATPSLPNGTPTPISFNQESPAESPTPYGS